MANAKRPPLPILKVQELGINRGNHWILRNVDWQVEPGQHWVILGANGSGKTSLLSALTGYLTPTEGEMTVLNEQYGRADWRELRRHIGLVSSSIRQMMAPDEPALEAVVSGKYAMIDLWGQVKAPDRREGLAMLKRLEIAHVADRPWVFLSQGERQRVLIGRALMAQPRLLILDEPCAGLDPVAREHFLQWLDRLGRRKHSPTLVLVTHHVEEIMPAFTHALVLQAGRILQAGPKENVLRSPLLSQAFQAKIKLTLHNHRYSLQVTSPSSLVV